MQSAKIAKMEAPVNASTGMEIATLLNYNGTAHGARGKTGFVKTVTRLSPVRFVFHSSPLVNVCEPDLKVSFFLLRANWQVKSPDLRRQMLSFRGGNHSYVSTGLNHLRHSKCQCYHSKPPINKSGLITKP